MRIAFLILTLAFSLEPSAFSQSLLWDFALKAADRVASAPPAPGSYPTYVQSNGKDSASGTTHTITLPTVTAASCLVLGFRVVAVTVSSVTDSSGNTWLDCGQGQVIDDAGNRASIWVAKNASAAASTVTVTVTVSGATTFRGAIAEFSHCSTSAPVDQFGGGELNTQTTATSAITTTTANEALVVFCESDGERTWTAGAGFTELQVVPAAPNTKGYLEYRNVFSTGAYVGNASFDLASCASAAVIVSLK